MIIPDYLQKGDKVGVVATAKKVNKANTLRGIDTLKSWGLDIKIGQYVFAEYMQFAGTDQERAEDFQRMVNDDNLKAVFLVRGGYGSTRIIDLIDYNNLLNSPKWICGFSDITAIHAHLFRLGVASIHAPMPSFFYSLDQEALKWFKDLMFGKQKDLKVASSKLNRNGQVKAKMVGGNLSIICHTIGTPSEIISPRNILLIEDVGEELYNLDRMMVQLKRAGFLNDLAGLVVGQFTDMKDTDPFGLEPYEIINQHVKDFDYPVAYNFPIGHSNKNYAVPIGMECEFLVDSNGARLILG